MSNGAGAVHELQDRPVQQMPLPHCLECQIRSLALTSVPIKRGALKPLRPNVASRPSAEVA